MILFVSDMAESLHTVLSKSHEPKLPLAERSELSIKETQTTYRLRFGKRRLCVAYQIDGKIISDGNKCDYLILAKQDSIAKSDEKWKSIFVELKGKDVIQALRQLDATLSHNLFNHDSINEVHARIVAKAFPANGSNTAFELEKRKFKRKHKDCTLKQVSSNQPDIMP